MTEQYHLLLHTVKAEVRIHLHTSFLPQLCGVWSAACEIGVYPCLSSFSIAAMNRAFSAGMPTLTRA